MDPIADLLSQIKNAYMAGKKEIITPWSKMRQSLVKILVKEGFLDEVKVKKDDKKRKQLVIQMAYTDQGQPVVSQIKRVSKPGRRIYTTADKIPVVLGGLGTTILSTSKGLMTDSEAKKKNLGGEVICQIY